MPKKYFKVLLKTLTLWLLIETVIFAKGKKKRQITFNPYTPMRLDFLWQAQIALMIPTLANIYAEKELPNPENSQTPEELFIDPPYEKQVQKVMKFFSLLKVKYMSCQERIICQLEFDKDSFYPISDFILHQIRLNRGPISQNDTSLMYRYVTAVQNGALVSRHDDCNKIYKHCGKNVYRLINMSVIKVWQYVSEELNVKFKVTEKRSRGF